MANNSGVQQQQVFHHQQQQQQQQQQQNNTPYQCKECGLSLNSAESLDVHLQYHKENLLKHWAVQAASSHSEETNNNMTKVNSIKREFIPNNTVAAADSSDMQKKSPEYNRTTPDNGTYGHPPTPQSYQSASSPYQNHDNSTFSPNFQNYQIKSEGNSPASHQQQQQQHYQNSFGSYPEQQQFFVDAANQQYGQDVNVNKAPTLHHNSFRYHPYPTQPQHSPYERPKSQSQPSPAYPPQPTPSPSPKQCDKCGYVCESAAQLIEHINLSHPPTPAYAHQHFLFDQPVKSEEDASQSEILDLDSHKVHQVYPDEEKRTNGDQNPHSVNAMLNSWPPQPQSMFQPQEPHMYPENKLFQPHQMNNQNFAVTSTNQDISAQTYRPFEHLPSQPGQVITSTQVPQVANNTPVQPPATTKSSSWKSNEARRPKTYNCTACNKWFTSSGHLKRHYNTTLHKNAVKSSGQPDPAALPISAHHHPARENNSNKDDVRSNSGSPREETRVEDVNVQFDRLNPLPGLLQQPPNGPYDRQPAPNIPPMGNPNFPNGSPPNGEAGLSPSTRGLLSVTSPSMGPQHGFNMMQPTAMHHQMETASQFQMYPNESSPHVSQAMAISNPSTTGEFLFSTADVSLAQDTQPLPSFAQIQAHRYGVLSYGMANVGGSDSVTSPFYYQQQQQQQFDVVREEEDYRLTVLTAVDKEENVSFSPSSSTNTTNNNNNEDVSLMSMSSCEDENKIQILQDIKFIQQDERPVALKKPDYEEHTTGSPLISSTTVANQDSKTKCFDCDKVFNRPCYLTQHNKTCHNGDKPFKCTRCGKRFSSEETYREHSSKHAGDKPHKCEICPKQFNHKTDLRRHMCCHTGRKPYTCETCGKGFIRKDHMVKHMETHLRKSQSKVAAVRG